MVNKNLELYYLYMIIQVIRNLFIFLTCIISDVSFWYFFFINFNFNIKMWKKQKKSNNSFLIIFYRFKFFAETVHHVDNVHIRAIYKKLIQNQDTMYGVSVSFIN